MTFISSLTNNETRSLLKLSTTYKEVNDFFKKIYFFFTFKIIDHIKEKFEELKSIEDDNLLLKAKLKRNGAYQDIINSEEKKLEDFVLFFLSK